MGPDDMTDSTPVEKNSEEEDESASRKEDTPKKPKDVSGKSKSRKNSQTSQVINIKNSNYVHIGSNHVYQIGKKAQPKKSAKSAPEIIPQDVKRLYSSVKPVTVSHIGCIKSLIGEKWKSVGRSLGYSDGQLDQLKHDNGIQQEFVYKMLLEWTQANGDIATVGNLCRTLCEAQELYAAKALCEFISDEHKD